VLEVRFSTSVWRFLKGVLLYRAKKWDVHPGTSGLWRNAPEKSAQDSRISWCIALKSGRTCTRKRVHRETGRGDFTAYLKGG